MARSGYAKGKNAGHVTEQLERKEKPSRTKGVRFALSCFGSELDSPQRRKLEDGHVTDHSHRHVGHEWKRWHCCARLIAAQ
mmetsp:Transcript_14954/g.43179  ORF Transcript_14954/g.43179 Transcript_14954/m.43179 type:complete len:81 (+) Transcript_14954:80-322(+)